MFQMLPFMQKGKRDINGNYSPVSILSNLTEIFEKCNFKQISHF